MCVIYAGGVRRRREGNKAMMLGQKLTDFTFDQKGKKRFGKCFNSIKRRENRELGLCVLCVCGVGKLTLMVEKSLHIIKLKMRWSTQKTFLVMHTLRSLQTWELSVRQTIMWVFSGKTFHSTKILSQKTSQIHTRIWSEFSIHFAGKQQPKNTKWRRWKGSFSNIFITRQHRKVYSLSFHSFSPPAPSSILCRHTDEKKKKSSNISRVVVEFSRREKQERPGEILKINLIIAIAITESVASHRIFSPSKTHTPIRLFWASFPLLWPS